ncbi:MAG: hypothetical protein ACO3A4_10980 [Silvanigrellaceae bacterium]
MNDSQKAVNPKPNAPRIPGRHRLQVAGLVAVLLLFSAACTQKPKKSNLRDLPADGADNGATLKQMNVKYSFVFIGSSGKKYPIYMTGDLVIGPTGQDAVWNSTVESDGGLVNATTESKTIKPDKSLQLKPTSSNTNTDPTIVVFAAGSPELGRGMSLSLQKTLINGNTNWKAVAMSYFGYDAQIEDSLASNSTTQQKM